MNLSVCRYRCVQTWQVLLFMTLVIIVPNCGNVMVCTPVCGRSCEKPYNVSLLHLAAGYGFLSSALDISSVIVYISFLYNAQLLVLAPDKGDVNSVVTLLSLQLQFEFWQ